ncbi:MAG: DegT/DnrJ/EryC1/StrS aminotransferase family protein [Ignavibacteria bacterium]|nr:DegT/DnrJ/EryC1/StrS aminotransferase family protein [Ignavibacteria bacterium]
MIPLMKSAFLNEFETKQALADFIIKAPKLSMDTQCFDFEKKFAKIQGTNDAILFNSGGSANLATIQSLKNLGLLKDGDYVGFSSLTWSTNVMPLIQLGLRPVPIDCKPETLNVMSENLLERLKEIKISALFITNALGFTGDLDKIKEICNRQNIILLEDNCESLGTELQSGKAGNYGIASSFSFFVAHHMSTIEGGMVCTDDDEIAEMLRMVRANGWDRNLKSNSQYKIRKINNVRSEFEAKYTFYDLGYNFRPTEITGFLGNCQLNYLDENIKKREMNYDHIASIIETNPELLKLDRGHIKTLSSFAFPIVCINSEIRTKYLSQFSGAGIEIRPIIAGNMQKQPFYKKYVKENFDLIGTDFLHECGFYCGNYPELTEMDLETISNCLRSY